MFRSLGITAQAIQLCNSEADSGRIVHVQRGPNTYDAIPLLTFPVHGFAFIAAPASAEYQSRLARTTAAGYADHKGFLYLLGMLLQ